MVAGALFACHGTQKLFGFPGDQLASGETLAIIAGLIETGAGAFVAAGYFTRPAAFLSSGTMAVAYFLRHAPRDFWPLVNRGELAVIYAFLFLYIAARGAGMWSADGGADGKREA